MEIEEFSSSFCFNEVKYSIRNLKHWKSDVVKLFKSDHPVCASISCFFVLEAGCVP